MGAGATCLGAMPPEDPSVFDVAIIGGGISGAYTAYKLNKMNRKLKVCIFEKSSRIGGRLLSDDNDEDNNRNKDELGGMRIFPSVQKPVAKIVAESGCNLIRVGLKDSSNIFYANGKSTKKRDVILDPEKGRSPKTLINEVNEKFKEEFGEIDPLLVEEIRGLNMRDILRRYGATEKEIEQYIIFTGYDLFSDDEVAAAIFLQEYKLYNSSLNTEQRYIREGYEIVAQKLAEKSKATIKFNCEVTATDPADDLHKIETTQGDFFARTLVFALPLPALQEMLQNSPQSLSPKRAELFDSVKAIPLFKCFIEWERDPKRMQWWEDMNLWEGKSTTDDIVRQVHYYDHEDILIYNSGKYADELNERFQKGSLTEVKRIYEFLKEMHGNPHIPEPDYRNIVFKYWPDGSHKWKRDVDIYSTMRNIVLGTDKELDSGVYICGDAFSTHQGWVMGCIQTADMCLESMSTEGRLEPL